MDDLVSLARIGNNKAKGYIVQRFNTSEQSINLWKGILKQYIKYPHIWGKAFDPRNFTNLWNFAIVPVWGNFLLDKTDSQDELTLKMINTFKAIAVKQYKMSRLPWASIKKCYKNMLPDRKYIVHGTCSIHIVENKAKKGITRPYGPIVKRKVTI